MSGTEDIMNTIKNLNEDFVVKILLGFIITIIILALVYKYYMATLLDKECSIMDSLYSTANGYIKSINSADPRCKFTLLDYYIKTAYNCCSGGAYKNDYVSTCNLKDVLKQGCRGLDFEIYSIGNEPIVATSTSDSNFVKETYNYVLFSDAMSIIINNAFATSTAPNPSDPIILHLRIKSTNQAMFQALAEIFKYYDTYFLGPEYSFENKGYNLGNVPLIELVGANGSSGKIVVIVDKADGTSFMDNKDFYEYVNMTSSSMFMRALRYYDVKNTPDLNELQQYNKRNMTIAMPDKGSNPPNPSAVVCREAGCQMVAMRYQLFDVNLQENIMFFDNAGYAFVLKPEKLRYVLVTIPEPPPQNPALSYATRQVASDYYKFDI
jgi:hypothetical protein